MINKPTITQFIGSTRIGWTISFIVWCIYWRICRRFNKETHFDSTYFISGWFRSRLLNIGADTHPTWEDRRFYYQRR